MAFSTLRNLFSSKRDTTKSSTDENKTKKKAKKLRLKIEKKRASLTGKGSETKPLISANEKAKSSTTMSLPETIDENALAGMIGDAVDSEELPTPPPSPQSKDEDDAKPSVFSVAQVSMKLNELWSTAKERLLGEDYWIPTNAYDVVVFPNECLKNYITSYPPHADEGSGNTPTLRVVQSQAKADNPDAKIINHVVFSHAGHRETLSIYRTQDFNDAMDFCRRCEECRVLFKMLDLGDKYKDIRRQVRDLTNKFQSHPLWRMVHIAIACQRTDVFTEDGLEFLHKMGYLDEDLIKTIAQPEGKFAIHLAVETGQADIVKFLFRHGADVRAVDTEGNNLLHYAALTSTQMIELVWSQQPAAKDLLNALNNDRNTPVLLAIRNANPFCLKALLNIGADMSIRIAGKNPLFEAVQSKGKTMDIIRAIIDAQPDLITEREEVTGNTVLHAALYKLPLMGVLNLRREDLDLNAHNNAGFTALQLFVSRGDIGMISTIASYGCSMDTQDTSGNTALHIAVSKNNLAVTRLLLCLGANPNILNKHGDTPRHLAAKLHEHDLLKSLIMCDAKRCANSKAGCVSGCVNEKMLRILPKTDSMQRVQSQTDDFKSPRSLSKIEELEAPEEMVPQHSWNQFHEIEHEQIYDEIITRLTDMAQRKEKNRNVINALCLDGGGIRGLVLMQILLEIEKQMGEPIFPYFDWVAGTSTGALCAGALSLGKTFRDCQMIYLRFKDLIFDGWVRPYKSAILETFIKAEMGEDTLVGDLDWPRLMFTTTRADVFPVQLEFMRNYQLPLSDEDNEKLGYLNPKELHLWKALRRSSAAPTYFSTVDNKYIDGGIMANNPTLDFLSEVQMWNMICKSLKRNTQVEIGCLLSIGTGVIPQVPMDASQLDISNNPYSSAVAIKNLGVILVDQVTATEGAPVNRASSWCITRRTPYFRLSTPLHKEVAMDERQDDVLAKMMWDCKEYMYRQRPYVEKICKLLRMIGPADSRRFLFEKFNCMATQTSRPGSPMSELTEEVKFKTASSSEDEVSIDEPIPKQPKSQAGTLQKSNSGSTTTLQEAKSSSDKLKKTATEFVEKISSGTQESEQTPRPKVLNDSPKLTRTDMIKATQGERRKGDRDQSPKASPEELKEAQEATTKHDAPNSRVTKGSPHSSTGSVNDLSKPKAKDSGN